MEYSCWHIAITGAPGTGKTTLARILERQIDCHPVFEDLGDNPFLEAYFAAPSRWSFHLSVSFMLRSLRSILAIRGLDRSVLWDYDPKAHFEVFCGQLLDTSLLRLPEYETCAVMHEVLAKEYRVPDLQVYLRGDSDVLLERIRRRNRDGELNTLSPSYLQELCRRFDRQAESNRGNQLTIDTTALDLVECESHQETVADLITSRLRALRGEVTVRGL